MAGLLRDYEHEDNGAKMGRVAKTATPCLHLEIMEERQDESEESDDTGNAEMASPQKRKLKKGMLGDYREWNSRPYDNKQKTRTGRMV